MRVLITGVSRGLGRGLAEEHLERGDQVFALSRTPVPDLEEAGLERLDVDLARTRDLDEDALVLPPSWPRFDLVWLNAGRLGAISDLADAELADLEATMHLNVWANKYVVEALMSGSGAKRVIAISSGASVNGNRGWSGYAISKAALNMLIQLLAAEYESTHFLSLAPGLVDTAMQDQIRAVPEDPRFPSLERLKAAHGTANMPSPRAAAVELLAALPVLDRLESGSFADIRKFRK